jgi:uncharacterized protein YndB with AHSA1/START domain
VIFSSRLMLADHPARPTLQLRRTFDAPRSLVWRAWTRPEMLVQWIGSLEWPAFKVTSSFRVGDQWRICLKSPDTGEELWQGGIYREIVELERLVFSFRWEGDNHEGGPSADTLVTVELRETADGYTDMSFTHEDLNHRHGWASTVDRLQVWLTANPG